jgi:NAD(P)-dependent dehydrogenase (short-subunit alcohol dehydrogenase family)
MDYFVTGGTGFLGRHLIELLLERGATIHVLVREASLERLARLRAGWGVGEDRVVNVLGDLAAPQLGVDAETIDALRGRIGHFFHVAALYDMAADSESLELANVEGTRHALDIARELSVSCFHHVSSIAAAGRYRGVFTEDMFDEARGLSDPYFRTKHDSERLVREEQQLPWRVYRPAIVVGHSQTGVMDKVDGPYFFFKLIQSLGAAIPAWVPLVGINGGPLNLVPVDFVARAMDHIAHAEGLDRKTFHLTDPAPLSLAESLNLFSRISHGPEFALNVDVGLVDKLPALVRRATQTPARLVLDALASELDIPPRILAGGAWETEFDCLEAEKALEGSGISVPPLEDYAEPLWRYWEDHLDADLQHRHSLRRVVEDKRVVVTGASSGIGKAAALKLGAAGARVLLVARSVEKLRDVQSVIEKAGGSAFVHPADLSSSESCDSLAREILEQHGGVDILINNAGRSIRRSLELAADRFHDYERTMQLNYFGAVKLILAFLPGMRERQNGHIINISSLGVQANAPRYSAYVASKAALDAFARCAAAELIDDGVEFTTVYMPLVKTPMIAPTRIYDLISKITPGQAADMICNAVVQRPKRVTNALGVMGEISYATSPKTVDLVLNTAFRLFPESAAARGEGTTEGEPEPELSKLALAFARLIPGVHW